jgi:putative DNA primase/helicase
MAAHTGRNNPADCRITLDDGRPPTIHCFHDSCKSEIASANKALRSAIGKAQKAAAPIRHSVVMKPTVAKKPLQSQDVPPPINGGMERHLAACFAPDEHVGLVGADLDGGIKSAGKTVLPAQVAEQNERGTFIRVNPMVPNGAGNSDVAAYRHVLIESDETSKPLQWAAINASGLPVSVVIDSGGKSLHAWVRVDAENESEYRARGKKAADAMDAFEGVKVDRSCLNPARLARLAGCQRGASRQELISLGIGAACWEEWEKPEPVADPKDDKPFLILGNLNRTYYYLSRRTASLVALTSAQHTRNALLELAPLSWWEMEMDKKGDVLIQIAVDWLIQTAGGMEFSPGHIRGRGAWLDEGRVVFHAGNALFVDGTPGDLLAVRSKYVYARAERLGVAPAEPLSNAEANKLRTLMGCFQFVNPLDSLFMAGWLVTSAICGALDWRPHVWLTGAAGSGKTTILTEVVEPLLSDIALHLQGNTTEAGIRQALGCDARPVIFDEAEGEGESGQKRMAEVIALARAASRESGAVMLKGGATGQAMSYRIRSSFLFASIAVSLDKRADQGRITVLELIPEHLRTVDHFSEAKKLMAETVDRPEWCEQWRARCISLAAVVAANAITFKQAARHKLDEARNADQVGALLAGAYALTSTDRITPEIASSWVDAQDWTFASADRGETDERSLLNRLLESWLQVDTLDGPGRARITVAEAIRQSLSENDSRARWAEEALARIGVKVRDEHVDIAISGIELKQRFGVTRWVDQLKRFPGAQRMDSQVQIGAMRKRTVRLPMSLF